MPVVQEYKDLDQYFHSTDRKLILNQFNHLEIDPDEMVKLLYTKYEEEISMVPQCECGHYRGAYLLGKVCPMCNTEVVNPFDLIKPLLWVEKYQPDLPFINPQFWNEMRHLLGGKSDSMRWLCDTSYRGNKIPMHVETISKLIGGRGYKNVLANMEKILLYIMNNSSFKANNKHIKAEELLEHWNTRKDIILSDHISLINKRLFVMEVTNKGIYTSTMLSDVIDAALLAIRLASLDPNKNIKRLENGVANLISISGNLFEKYMRDKVSSKSGLMRKHIYGTRSHFTFRAVITSLPSGLDYDELHVPWIIGVTAFRPHLLNKLIKRGYRYKDASDLLYKAVLKYYPLIDELLQELINESPYKGIPVLFNRNPSLLASSLGLQYITKFKTDIEDRTIGVNMLVIKGYGGDFDG